MKGKIVLFVFLAFFLLTASKSDRPAYRLFNTKGHRVDYGDLLNAAKNADVVFFGEIHSDPICHWLELQLTKDLDIEKNGKLVLGAEMFERDNQLLLNEYISSMIRKRDFESEAKLWPNYKTDYAALVDYAVERGIKFIATSIPRRFAAMVNLKGFEGLDSINGLERGMIAQLPIKYNPELNCYKKIGEMVAGSPMHMGDNLPKAQAIKDATMAYFIFKNLTDSTVFLHFNGSYHSDNQEGIVWYLKDYNKRNATDLRIVTITSVEQKEIDDLGKDNLGKADYIICIPEDMTKTQPEPAGSVVMPPAPARSKPDTLKKKVNRPEPEGDGDDD